MKKLGALVLTTLMIVGITPAAFAVEPEETAAPYSIEFDDSTLNGATKISEETYEENGRLITVTKYCTVDGSIITDTFERASIRTFSKNGTDTATRTRDMEDYGKITVTATFQWYTDPDAGIPGIGVSYVKCNSVSTSHTNVHPNIVTSKWDEFHTSEYQAFGVAKAGVTYYMYNRQNPAAYQSGSVTITCDDTGAISDNL